MVLMEFFKNKLCGKILENKECQIDINEIDNLLRDEQINIITFSSFMKSDDWGEYANNQNYVISPSYITDAPTEKIMEIIEDLKKTGSADDNVIVRMLRECGYSVDQLNAKNYEL